MAEKILIVHNYYLIPGGEDAVVANEKKMLEAHGHKVILYSRTNSELKEMSWLKKLRLPFAVIFNPRTYREIKRIIRKEHIEIVHVHNTLPLISPAVYYAAVKCGVPIVQTVHNFRLLCPGATFYRNGHICEDCVSKGLGCAVKYNCYRGSKAQTLACVVSSWFHRRSQIYRKISYITLTEFNKQKLLQLNQIRPEQVYVKPNFVENDGTVLTEKEGFIFAGRLDELKGIDVLLRAWRFMGNTAPHLTICGTGPMEEWCQDAAKGLNVEMKGIIPNDDVKKLMAKSKALILPTMWYEGFPMSIVEAYSVGTPVICSNLGNAGSVVIEGVTGFKFKAGNAEDLAETIKKFPSSDLGGNVIREYQGRYSEKKNYLILTGIYNAIKNV